MKPRGWWFARALALSLSAGLLCGAAAGADVWSGSPDAPAGDPQAIVDLATAEGVALMKAAWRYSDTKIVEVDFRAAGADGQPTGAPDRTYDFAPHAGAADFDDSTWEVIEPTSLSERRSTGRLCFNWYRITLTVPEKVGAFDPTGSTLVFETSLDDYAEVWVDGEIGRAPGQSGGSMVKGWNAPNRLVLARDVRPGQRIQLAVFGINGPLSNPPTNYIWMRQARLEFHPTPLPGPVAFAPHEVNVEVIRNDPAIDAIVPPNAKVFKLAEGFLFTEGPVWSRAGHHLLFSDPNRNTIYKYADGQLSVFRERSGYEGADIAEYGQPGSNGLTLDKDGRLTIDQHGNRRVVRLEAGGRLTVLADRFQGKRLNSPNDLVYRSDGTLYFTDPPFGLPRFFDDRRRELSFSGVYAVKDGKVRLLSQDLEGPNGIAFSPDERTLYVGDWDDKKKVVMAYDVRPDGSLGPGRVFFDLTPAKGQDAIDGLKVDERGGRRLTGGEPLAYDERAVPGDGRIGPSRAPLPRIEWTFLTEQVPAQADLQEALYELRQYLSDRLAPLMAMDSITLLLGLPARLMADEMAAWSGAQAQIQGPRVPFSDYLFHAVRKIHLMEEFHLIPAEDLEAFLADLVPAVLEHCPAEQRDRLKASLGKIGQARPTKQDKVEILYRQGEGVEMQATATAQPATAMAEAFTDAVQDLRRLPLILERLERAPAAPLATGPPGATPAMGIPVAGAVPAMPRTALLAEALLEAALGARNGAELDKYLERIRQRGGAAGTDEMFRALGQSLSGWLLPPVAGAPEPPEGAQVDAMRRLIAFPEDPAEGARRFREMVHAAIDQFNEGALGRAVKMFALAEQMIAEGKLKSAFVEPMVASGHEYLNPDRLKKLAESPDKHPYLRPVLRFFRAFSPQKLLDQLQDEPRRDKRRLLLTLIEIHGEDGRAAAYERLVADPGGTRTDVYLMRNVVSLLRAIPRADDIPSALDAEVAHVAGLLRPGVPLLLMKEVFQYLGQAHHERAEKALLDFLAGIEEALVPLNLDPEDREALMIQADRVCSALARSGSALARAALVDHALKRTPALGDTLARLADLGRQDLSGAPEIVARLLEAIRADLPRGVLSRLVPTREADLRRLVAALASTPTPEVRELLKSLGERFPSDAFGREAAKTLSAFDAPTRAPSAPASLSGDLELFGLPMLVQSLADAKRTGTLTLLDRDGKPVATINLDHGQLRGGQFGHITGRAAFYQIIEQPFQGTFAFVSRSEVSGEPADPETMMGLVLEGVRRHDHLQRGRALVPDDVPLAATGKSPSTVPNEPDYDIVVKLWEKACSGVTPRQCAADLPVDSYRIWNALSHWVEEGALGLK